MDLNDFGTQCSNNNSARQNQEGMPYAHRDIYSPNEPVNRPIQWAFGQTLTAMARRIMGEDIGIWNEVQRGIAASHNAGVLSRREERVRLANILLATASGMNLSLGWPPIRDCSGRQILCLTRLLI